jgi:hypothetical protein
LLIRTTLMERKQLPKIKFEARQHYTLFQ